MTVSYGEHQLDLDAMRGDQITEWRRRRQNELERGDDPEALLNAIEETEREPLEILWSFIFGANQQGDAGILAVRELMANLIRNTLDFEEERGDWK